MPAVMTIEYPDTLPDVLHETIGEFEQEARMALAVKLFEMGRVPSGTAAALARMDRVSFLLALHRYGVAAINLDEQELLSDIRNA